METNCSKEPTCWNESDIFFYHESQQYTCFRWRRC